MFFHDYNTDSIQEKNAFVSQKDIKKQLFHITEETIVLKCNSEI